MLDAATQSRFNRSCSDAALGYANATAAACASMTKQTFEFWTSALRAVAPPPPEPEKPRSWYRHPDEPKARPQQQAAPVAMFGFMPLPQSAWAAAMPSPMAQPNPVAAMMAPWTTWLEMWSSPRVSSSWPMAMMLVSVGVPHAVAVPTAEANAATLEALTIARTEAERMYSAYRSEGGHASTHVTVSAHPRPGSPAMWPWLH